MPFGGEQQGRRFGGGALVEHAGPARRVRLGSRGERERLQLLNSLAVLGPGTEPEFDSLARVAARLAGTTTAAVTFVNGAVEQVKSVTGARLPDVDRALAFGGEVVAHGVPLVVLDASRQAPFAANPWVAGPAAVRFYAGVPIRSGGLVVGTLAAMDSEPRQAADGDLIDALGDAVSALTMQLERRREEVIAQNLTALVGFDGRFQRVSPAIEAILGWRPDEMVGRHCLDFAHPDDAGRVASRIERLTGSYRGGKGFESRYRCKDGGYRWLLWTSQALPAEKRIYCAGKDITDRKGDEIALRESEARYRTLAENATDVVSAYGLDGRITYVSSAVAGMASWRVDELVGGSVYDLMHPDDVEAVRACHGRLLERMQPVRYSYRLRRKDESYLWVESHARVVRDARSRPVGIQVTTRDISRTKQAVAALEQARERFRRAFDDAPIGMLIATRGGAFERVNDRLCELLGYSEEHFLSALSPLDLVHPEDRCGEEEGLRGVLRGKRDRFAIERRLIASDGRAVWARVTTSALREGPDIEPRLLAHVEDISEPRRHADELRRASDEAERANRAKSEFLSRMSHELRTPLNAVLGFAQLIDAEDGLTDSQRESIDRVLRGGYHLLNLVNEVLDMSAIEAGRLPIVLESVSAQRLVGEAVDLVRPQAAERAVTVRCEYPDGDVMLRANAQRLRQVVLNLVANAVKYGPSGSEVTVDIRAGDGLGRIEVTDSGPGIPPHQLERAFLPFERLGSSWEVEGTGLGLPVSLRLVEAMDGTLTVQSEHGGSTFTVELPLGEDAPPPAPAPIAPSAAANGRRADDTAVRRILYIEDNPSNVALVKGLVMRRGGLRLDAVGLGGEGIELARRSPPDLVMVDLELCDATGYEVLRRLRTHPATMEVPVIVVTADVTQDHEARLIAAGATAYLTKPLDLERFGVELERALVR